MNTGAPAMQAPGYGQPDSKKVGKSERRPMQMDRYCMSPLIRTTQNCHIQGGRKQNGGYQGLKWENEELLFNGHRVLVWDDGKVLEMNSGDGYTKCEYT